MASIRRSRSIAAPRHVLWRIVADPRTQPEWWPGVERIESVSRHGFTQVMRSSRGVVVRADFKRADQSEPQSLLWDQQLAGTPFDRVFRARSIAIELAEQEPGRTKVTLRVDQLLQGAARFSPQLNRGGIKRQLDAALVSLEAVVGS